VTVKIEPQKFIPDYEGREILNFRLQQATSGPSAVEGLHLWRSDLNRWVVHDGTAEQEIAWMSDLAAAGSWDAEQTRDAIAAAVQDSATIDFTDNDGANTMALDVKADSITAALQANVAEARVKGRAAGAGTGDEQDLTGAQVKTILEIVASDISDFSTAVSSVAQDLINAREFKGTVDAVAKANVASLSGTTTIDGVALAAGMTVLLVAQTNKAQEGPWVVAAGAWTRDTRADTTAELADATFLVDDGTDGKGELWTQTANVVTVGTTNQSWVKTGDANVTYIADEVTLTLSGSTFSVKALGIDTAHLADGSVTAAKLNTAVAGDGLTGGGGSPLAVGEGAGVTVDGDTVGIDTAVVARKASGNLGNGSLTDTPFTHNLGTTDVIAVIRDATTGRKVDVPWAPTSSNVVTVYWPDTPTTDQYRITVIG
jgi:hypothetical protein